MFKVVLHRIESFHNNLRDDRIEGLCDELPRVGEGFNMHGNPGNNLPGYIRIISTSPVSTVRQDRDEYVFQTKNSIYLLEVLDQPEPQPF